VRVAVWTVNDDADVDRAAAMGVDAIITDDPERTRARLATRR
jgi:glycerophosphoryl diester phosphodiesterase